MWKSADFWVAVAVAVLVKIKTPRTLRPWQATTTVAIAVGAAWVATPLVAGRTWLTEPVAAALVALTAEGLMRGGCWSRWTIPGRRSTCGGSGGESRPRPGLACSTGNHLGCGPYRRTLTWHGFDWSFISPGSAVRRSPWPGSLISTPQRVIWRYIRSISRRLPALPGADCRRWSLRWRGSRAGGGRNDLARHHAWRRRCARPRLVADAGRGRAPGAGRG